jgi:hypothetical protein
LNKHVEYYENLDLFGCFGDHGSLEVAIGDQGSLEVAHNLFFCFFLLFDCFLQQSPIHIITMSFWNEEERARLDKMQSELLRTKKKRANGWRRSGKELKVFLHHAPLRQQKLTG